MQQLVNRFMILVGVAFFIAACAAGPTEEQMAQLNNLKNEVASLEKQVAQKEQEKASVEKELAEKTEKLNQCMKDIEVAKERLKNLQ